MSSRSIVIAVDGTAASGKGTLAKKLAVLGPRAAARPWQEAE